MAVKCIDCVHSDKWAFEDPCSWCWGHSRFEEKEKKMGEYIIELKEDPKHIRLMQLKNGADGLPVTQFVCVRPYTPPDIQKIKEDAYEEGYEKGYADATCDFDDDDIPALRQAYKDGVDDAWGLARKVYLSDGYSSEVLNKFFHTACVDAIFEIRHINKVLSEINEWEDEQEKIGVGDEVTFRDGEKGVVIAADDRVYRVINSNMMAENLTADQVKKTGRHFDEVGSILEKFREGEG